MNYYYFFVSLTKHFYCSCYHNYNMACILYNIVICFYYYQVPFKHLIFLFIHQIKYDILVIYYFFYYSGR